MNSKYSELKNNLRSILSRFRWELLFSDLLKGAVFLAAYVLLYLFVYYCFISFFPVTVFFKSVSFFLFFGGGFFLLVFFLFRPLYLFAVSFNLRNKTLLRRLLQYCPSANDVFVSLYDLAFLFDTVSGDEQLKEAAFVQKYRLLDEKRLRIAFPFKLLLGYLAGLLFLTGLFFLNGRSLNSLYRNMAAYDKIEDPRLNIEFVLLNESLNAEYGKPFQLKLKADSEFFEVENVFVCYGGGEFLMNRRDSLFLYTFDMVNNDIHFYFKTGEAKSGNYRIKVLPTPEISGCEVTVVPPSYTGLKAEVLKDIADFRVLYGSVLRFHVYFSNIDTLFLQSGGKWSQIALKSQGETDFSRSVTASGEYTLWGSNADFTRKNLMNFSVTCIPDLYPGIQVSELQDSLNVSLHYFYGVITDDYGFSDLRFNYSLNGQTNTVVPVRVNKNLNTQEFYFEFNFAEFAGMDKAKISYFFEVFDNDVLSGPKSTRSDAKNYLVPDLNTIFDYNTEVNAHVNTAMNEAEKLARDIVSGVKDLQKKMLDNSVDKWEKQQLSKDIVEKKNKLDKLLSEVKEQNQKKSSLNNNFTKQDSVLQVKQQKIQELLDNIMDDEMKKLMEEFSKLSEEFSKEKFQDIDEKMKLGFDQLSEELDRNIELLKRYQIEEQHNMLSQQLEQLKEQQNRFEDRAGEMSPDSLSKDAEDIQKKLESIQDNYNKLQKENKQLSQPYDLKEMDDKFAPLSEDLQKQKENASEGKKDDKLSDKIKKEMDQLSEEMEKQQQENFMQMSLPQKDIELIIQNILLISFSQEDLLYQFREVPAQSARYNELGRLQDMKKLEYKIVKDSLSAIAKTNLMLASVLNDKFYDIEIKFGLLPDYIQNNKRKELLAEQQYIISYLNDMALVLSEALQKDKSEEGESGGNGESDNSGGTQKKGGKGDKKEGYGNLKKYQNGLKRQMEDLLSQMKKGEKGKPLQQGISKIIRENELFRQSLNEFMSGEGSFSAQEKQLLNEINKLLEDNIRDVANYSVTNNLIQRNNLIYNKLLMSEKASQEREEYEERRKSVTADDTKFKRPELYFKTDKKRGLMKTDLQKSGLKLSPYFKNLYNNYYIKLGDE
ncbi:MAG: hypothetical protein NC410_08015 [Oscillibacter sp.]|nr:hypothetical protein [Oscillibacter sp.]